MANRQVAWGKGRKEAFKSWFHEQLHNTIGDRASLESQWADNLVQWRARVVGTGTADVPFVGASDIELPLTSMHSDPIYSDFMQTLHLPKNFWTITALRPDAVDVAKPLEEFFKVVESKDIHMRRVNERVLMDVVVHGTGIYKDMILHERKKVQDYNEAGELADVIKIRFQPLVQHVPLQDFFIPAAFWDIDADAPNGGSPWVCHRYKLTQGDFKKKAQAEPPFLPAYDKAAATVVQEWVRPIEGDDTVRDKIREEDQYTPYREDKITLYEVWARFDTDGDGIEEDIVVDWHHDTDSILRATHNPYVHGKRPFEVARYLPGFGFYGLGVAEIDEWAQLSISRLLNSAVDNAFLANTIMAGVPMGMGISPDEPFYPGKLWPLGPNEKIQEIQIGRPYPGMMPLIQGFMQWSEQKTSISELRQGDVSSIPSRTPASTVMQVLNESNKRFDMILGNMRAGALHNIGLRMLQNLVQISKDDPRYIALAIQSLGEQDGMLVADVLRGPVHTLESMFGVSVTATSSQANKEMEKQNAIFLSQQASQMYPQLFQWAQMLMQATQDSTLMLGVAQAGYSGTLELLKQLLVAHDQQNLEDFMPPPMQPTQQQPPMLPPGMPQQGGAVPPALGGLGGPAGAGPLAQGAPALMSLLGLG